MYDITDPKIIKYLCSKYGFTFSKSMGQNFITDESVPLAMALHSCSDSKGVIEIGPGFGSLTAALSSKAEKVVAIELDRRLEKVLDETLAGCSNVKFIWEDCLKVDLKKLLEEEFSGMDVSVAANLPYYITTPIIMTLLESRLPFKRIVVMIQKEVAERLCAKPGSKDYGAVTVSTQYYSEPKILKNVPASSFIPAPKVDSAVISLEILPEPKVKPKDEKIFFSLIKAAFSQRRKTLANALASSGKFGDKERIISMIKKSGFEENIRGERLSLEDFCLLSDNFVNS